MDHVAIDLGARKSQICVRDASGKILRETKKETLELGGWLAEQPASRVIVEACTQAFAVARAAKEVGHDVRVVPATLVRMLGVGARKMKTDQRDARALSEASTRVDLGSIHLTSQESRDRKAICSLRDVLVRARTRLINAARAFLRGDLVLIPTGAAETAPARIRKALSENTIPMTKTLEGVLASIDTISAQITEADLELKAIASSDERCKRLMTVPGVGPVVSVNFVATVDQPERFENPHQLESYLGLTPGEDSSSERTRRLSITKAGSTRMRFLLVQAAWSARRTRPNDPMVRWSLEVEKRRGKQIAVTALARKLAGILFALLRDGTTYQPSRGATALPAPPPGASELLALTRKETRRREKLECQSASTSPPLEVRAPTTGRPTNDKG